MISAELVVFEGIGHQTCPSVVTLAACQYTDLSRLREDLLKHIQPSTHCSLKVNRNNPRRLRADIHSRLLNFTGFFSSFAGAAGVPIALVLDITRGCAVQGP